MAGYAGIAAVGKSIERMLNLAFTERQPVIGKVARAVVIRTDDLAPALVKQAIGTNALSIFLYRVDFNKAMRATWSSVGAGDGKGHLALDLHFLLTPWAENAEHEQMILGRAMQELEFTPVFSGPLLYAPALPYPDEPQAGASEAVQIMLEEISTEALMRIFDSLPTDYRLSVPYVARVVRLDTRNARAAPPVLDARSSVGVDT
jgi:hypothetical protein